MADRPKTTLSTTDIVELIGADHQAAKELLGRFETLDPEGRESYFHAVVTELVRHEVAEEHVVYPIIRHGSPQGAAEATNGSPSSQLSSGSCLVWRRSIRAQRNSRGTF